jgi:transposase
MLPESTYAPQGPATPRAERTVGVGIDVSRYGHYAAFLRDDLQPAADELAFAESAQGYEQLRARLELIVRRHGDLGAVRLLVRIDVAGQYADNLIHFLHRLGQTLPIAVSCGDPQRNKNYRVAVFGSQKSDPIEARAAARFAVTERPAATTAVADEMRVLRQGAGRLQAVVRQRTRLINQLHHLLALTFPELALLIKDIAAGWVLELVHRYPTARQLAQASESDVGNIAYLPDKHVKPLLAAARSSIASLDGSAAEELVRDQIRQLRDTGARQKRLEILLVDAYRRLPEDNHLATIPGIGDVTAAVLTAFIVDIERFNHPNKVVKYFGVLPIEASSGIDREGRARGPKRYVMSRRGNDLVRRYLWMAALSAVRFNPAVRALYARVVRKHPQHKAIAIGHAMRKLIHLAFAVWKTGRPFNPHHYPWTSPAHVEPDNDIALSQNEQAAGLNPVVPALPEVAAACSESSPHDSQIDERTPLDFAHLKRQLPMARVLDHLGLSSRLRGAGPQRRCACPLHRGDARGRTFSVHLDEQVFQCFDAKCAAKGDVIDLWSKLHHMPLREAALDLMRTFHLEPSPLPRGPEKRNG